MDNNFIKKILFILNTRKNNLVYFIVIFVISCFIELVSLGLIIPFILMIFGNKQNYFNFDLFNNHFSIDQTSLILTIIFFLISKYLILLYINYQIPKFAFDIQKDLRLKILNNFFINEKIKNLNELTQLSLGTLQIFSSQFIMAILNTFASSLILFFLTLYLIYFNFYLTFFILFLFLFIFSFYHFYFKSKFKLLGQNIIEASEKIILFTSELFKGKQEIKIYEKSNLFINKLKISSSQLSNAETISRFLITLPRFFLETIIIFSFFISALLLPNEISNEKSILSLGVFAFAALRMVPSIILLVNSLNNLKYSSKTVESIYNSIKNSKTHIADQKQKNTKIDFKEITVKNIDFAYPNQKSKIFENVSFSINKGDFIGVIGESGSGKTTLIKIILGLLRPTKGKILYNGLNMSLENFSSYIPQDLFILRGSIRENISLDSEVNKKKDIRIFSCLKRSGLYNFVKYKRRKLNYFIHDDGKNLSGGQKQRLVIARAMYHKKNLVILDEATSGLESKKESQIILDLFKDKALTKILISHNKKLMKFCNKILILNKNTSKLIVK